MPPRHGYDGIASPEPSSYEGSEGPGSILGWDRLALVDHKTGRFRSIAGKACSRMKTPIALVTIALLTAISLAVASPIVAPPKECPLYKLLVYPNPFEATALPGYYLGSANGVAVLVSGRLDVTSTYSSNGLLGLWGSGPTTDGCPGYSYLNAHPTKRNSYSTLTWDAEPTTNWNATVNADLTKLGFPASSTFLACKRPSTSSKIGTYVLLLESAVAITLDDSVLTSVDGDTLTVTLCIPTKIRVTPTTPV